MTAKQVHALEAKIEAEKPWEDQDQAVTRVTRFDRSRVGLESTKTTYVIDLITRKVTITEIIEFGKKVWPV